MPTSQTLLINPCGTAAPPRYHLAARRALAPGATLGVLNNGKTNVRLILDQIAAALQARCQFGEIVHMRKPGVAHPCPEAQLQEFAARCDVVINGVGD